MPTVRKQKSGTEPRRHILRPEIRSLIPDANDPEVQTRLKAAIAALDPEEEREILEWMEKVADWGPDESGWTPQE
jgi:hypothetical protein